MEIAGKIKLAIFDFEGTLVDFQWQLQAALDMLRPRLEKSIVTADLDREIIAEADYCRLYNYLQSAIRDESLKVATLVLVDEVFDFFDADAARRWQLYPEIREVLESLQAAGWKLALDSNVGCRALERMFSKFSLKHYFDVVITRDDVSRLKPDPEGIEKILASYREEEPEPEFAILIGDSVTDIETARNAGLKVAVRTHGEDRLTRLRAHRPDYLVGSLTELKELLPE